ncbi:hypothetical protein ACFHW2_25990 [Actinomadura sp. LOL_016]|uniref:hypothetical protein n=1 Tax=unclassified Actinomadura TaxID=2626254 RepID=UPI003A809CA0
MEWLSSGVTAGPAAPGRVRPNQPDPNSEPHPSGRSTVTARARLVKVVKDQIECEGPTMPRHRNERLAALLAEADWSRAQAAAAYNRVADEHAHDSVTAIGRSHVSMWVGGTTPTGAAPAIVCEALSRRLNRLITPAEAGIPAPDGYETSALEWSTDPLTTLADLGRRDLDPQRRSLLAGMAFSAVPPALPEETWWRATAIASPPAAPRGRPLVGKDDVQAVRQLTIAFSQLDQQHGGGHGRTAVAQYLNSDVAALLQGRFAGDQVRHAMFAAAGELAYLCGWMAFDDGQHGLAQRYFHLALELTARSGDAPLAGHILRAMAHQAGDLGFPELGLELSAASMRGQRYRSASPRERALLGVVHARRLAATGQTTDAAKALLRAEDDLRAADPGIEEPPRTFFFGEAALAHETGCALRDTGDPRAAIDQFHRSVRTRGASFRRTRVVTLGYLGAAQITAGDVRDACATWSTALDGIVDGGIHSGRARSAVRDMRTLLTPFRKRRLPEVAHLDGRAAAYLRA